MNNKTLEMTRAALIAAIYVVMTFVSQSFGLASGVIQFRLSESLTCLPIKYKEAIPGLTIGCVIANLLTGSLMLDVIFGALATFIGAIGTYYLGKRNRYLGFMCPVISNMIIIPFVLQEVYGVPDSLPFLMATVGLGEFVMAFIVGSQLFKIFEKNNI